MHVARRTPAALGAPVAAACSSAVCVLHGSRVCAPCCGAAMGAASVTAALLLATMGALLPGAHGGAPTMWLQGLLEIDPLAVCNDGSPAGFYFVPGTTQSNIWLVYLEGGMWCVAAALCSKQALASSGPESFAPCARRCYDQTSCDYRFKNAGYSMSSSTWKDYFSQGGIFETNPVKSPIAGVRQPRAALARLWLNS